jgi:hypothetical protein
MPTTQEEKPAKPRSRSRKAPEQRNSKAAPKTDAAPAEILPTEAAPIVAEATESEAVVSEAMTPEASDVAIIATTLEKAVEAPLSGEVLPPQAHDRAGPSAGLLAIAQAHDDYAGKSWANSRFLVERLIAARSFDAAIEAHNEFARQAYANFLAHSQRICGLYGEWAQQLFRPFDKFAMQWTRR